MTNTIIFAAIRNQIVLLGKELEFASGIRAVAAYHFLKSGFSADIRDDVDEMFKELEHLIGEAAMYESYVYGQELLVEGCTVPFPSLEAYLALNDHYGCDWLELAMIDYCAHFGSVELRSNPEQFAKDYLERARDNLNHAEKPAPKESPLAIFGREFESFGGMRPLALAHSFPDVGEPIDCICHLADECKDRLGDELVWQGIESEEKLEDICGFCFDLRQRYGSSKWIKQGLLSYLTEAKGLDETDAEKEADRLIQESKERIAPHLDAYAIRKEAKRREYLAGQVAWHERQAAEFRQQLATSAAA
jgi:hypothetical protein